VSFKILAEVEFSKDTKGVIVSQGSRFGGYTLFVKDGKLVFVYNFLGIPPEQKLSCQAPTSGKRVVGVDFKKKSISKKNEALGTMTLYDDDKVAGSADFRTQSGHYALAGEGLAIGYDSGDRVSAEYSSKFAFSGRPDHQGDVRHRRRCLRRQGTGTCSSAGARLRGRTRPEKARSPHATREKLGTALPARGIGNRSAGDG
jgi:hypothetical protein